MVGSLALYDVEHNVEHSELVILYILVMEPSFILLNSFHLVLELWWGLLHQVPGVTG